MYLLSSLRSLLKFISHFIFLFADNLLFSILLILYITINNIITMYLCNYLIIYILFKIYLYFEFILLNYK